MDPATNSFSRNFLFCSRHRASVVIYLCSVIFVSLLMVPSSRAFPSGAPLSACSHLMPVHINGALLETASPYLLLLNDTVYSKHPLKLTITTIGPNARNFMAFMLQARSEFGEPVGRFSQVNLPGASKTMTCYGKDDTLTHTAAFIRPAMDVLWHPPAKNVGKISITGSIAVTKDNFWAVRSEPLKGTGKLDLSESRAPNRISDNNDNNNNGACSLTGGFVLIGLLTFIATRDVLV